MKKGIALDQVGAVASFACAVHCAVQPVAVSLSAAGVVSFLDSGPVEWGLVILAGVVGTVSAWRGYKTHGNKTVAAVLAMAALGLVFLTLAPHAEHAHHPDHASAWALPLIGLTIAVAHVVNLRLCRACRGCDGHAER